MGRTTAVMADTSSATRLRWSSSWSCSDVPTVGLSVQPEARIRKGDLDDVEMERRLAEIKPRATVWI